jgi:hypothetical protein
MEVAGSADAELFRKVRHNRLLGAAAIASGTSRQGNANYFGLAALPIRQLIEPSVGYTPLIASGNSLVLYDQSAGMPVAPDTRIVGVIGNGAYYPE